ncbi:hypothetical protein [Paenibacillus gallinarum]|uniref:Uncharacterized protein n=1 Tax=Paenibacillus gallinarum TaxID=2762232 RepID=A0ABR8T5N2_9BACL|nr:hypothetical protein [Paenibacillus gallinarum]MBD7971037.1 hypothetical protein [Paenibacillus gallinarum]
MKNKIIKMIGTTVLSISLITGIASFSLASNDDVSPEEGNEINEVSPYSLKDILNWVLERDTVDPVTDYFVSIGYPYIKLDAKNTGAQPFRIEVKHNSKNTIIFNETVEAGETVEFINNDNMPPVPSGAYTVNIYGGSGLPKGQVVLISSDTRWP